MKNRTTVALLPTLTLLFTQNAFANFETSKIQKTVTCYGEDNMSVTLNAKRTAMKYEVEGESRGAKKILKVKTDNLTFVSYSTSEGILTLSNQGDTYEYLGDEAASTVKCR